MADNTASLVVALSAQLTKFEKDMKKAGIMAGHAVDDIEKKFAGINPQMSGSFLGNLFSNVVTKGIEAATKAITEFYDRFTALQSTAKLTALSMEQVWAFQEAAKAGGASIDNATKSLEKMTFLVDQMNRGGENSLTKLLDANPEAMRGFNKETITLSQTLQVVANITRDFNEQVRKVSAVRLAGMTDDLVPALEKGGAALQKLLDAKAAGAPPLFGEDRRHFLREFVSKSTRQDAKQGAIGAVIHDGLARASSFAPRAACTSFSRRAASASATSRQKVVSL